MTGLSKLTPNILVATTIEELPSENQGMKQASMKILPKRMS